MSTHLEQLLLPDGLPLPSGGINASLYSTQELLLDIADELVRFRGALVEQLGRFVEDC